MVATDSRRSGGESPVWTELEDYALTDGVRLATRHGGREGKWCSDAAGWVGVAWAWLGRARRRRRGTAAGPREEKQVGRTGEREAGKEGKRSGPPAAEGSWAKKEKERKNFFFFNFIFKFKFNSNLNSFEILIKPNHHK